jgi:predicted patatin/cPLA2 family phospholipase
MYRVREGAANPPRSCPACGGALRAQGGAPAAAPPPAAPAGPDPKIKELESKLQALERDQTAARAAAELKDKELQEAQAGIARLGSDLEKAQAAYKEALKKKEQEISDLKARVENEGTKTRAAAQTQTMALLKAKDDQLAKVQEKVAELEEQLSGKGAAPAADAALEQELADARSGIAHIREEFALSERNYSTALKNKEIELDELQKKNADLERRMVEAMERAQKGGGGEPNAELQRALARVSGLEKMVQDGEQRYRSVAKQLEALQEKGGDAALGEKDVRIKELEEELDRTRQEMAQIRERATSMRRPAAVPAPAAPPGLSAAARERIGEAKYLAADLDRSLASVGTSLSALVERVKRLAESLEAAGIESPPAEESLSFDAVESSPPPAEPEGPPPVEAPAEEEPAAEAPPEETAEVRTLEELPDAEPAEESGLPADETLLDMGGVNRPKREDVDPEAATPPPVPPAEGEAPARPSRRPATQPPKKGFFGKLFGKK